MVLKIVETCPLLRCSCPNICDGLMTVAVSHNNKILNAKRDI